MGRDKRPTEINPARWAPPSPALPTRAVALTPAGPALTCTLEELRALLPGQEARKMPVPRELQAPFPPSITGQGSQALPGCVMSLQENGLTRTTSGWHWVPREGPLGPALTLLPLPLLLPGLPQVLNMHPQPPSRSPLQPGLFCLF